MAYGQSVFDLLFRSPRSDGRPMFASRSRLAERIGEMDLGLQPGTIATALSEAERRGGLSERVGKAVREAVSVEIDARALPDTEADYLRETVGTGLDELRLGNRLNAQPDARLRMIECSKSATLKFSISAIAPFAGTSQGRKALELLVTSLRLEEPGGPAARHVLCVGSETLALHYWIALHQAATEHLAPFGIDTEGSAERLLQLEANGLIEVYALDPALCATPAILYDIDTEEGQAFVVYPLPTGAVSVMQVPDAYVSRWKEFYLRFMNDDLPGKRVRLTWKQLYRPST